MVIQVGGTRDFLAIARVADPCILFRSGFGLEKVQSERLSSKSPKIPKFFIIQQLLTFLILYSNSILNILNFCNISDRIFWSETDQYFFSWIGFGSASLDLLADITVEQALTKGVQKKLYRVIQLHFKLIKNQKITFSG